MAYDQVPELVNSGK